ncbi:hypothetical protein DyAD56_13265 [Dyella sp. AD56]|nr:hypothetical protein DyAD56_13265 [Dyella sp. AD56]
MRLQQVMKQNAFLQRRKRIDILDIARATRHSHRDGVDIRLR